MHLTVLFGLGITLATFFLRYAVTTMPKFLAWIGVLIGVLVMVVGSIPEPYRPPTLAILLLVIGLFSVTGAGYLYWQHVQKPIERPALQEPSVALPTPQGGGVIVQGNVSAGSGKQRPGGNVNIEGGTGYAGASGGNVTLGPGEYRAGDGGSGGRGGDLNIKGGDSK